MPNLNIVMLGGSGAGKTMYLASLFKTLAIQGNKAHNSFFLDLKNEQRIILNNIYAYVVSTKDNWPPGTRGIKDWQFKCRVKNENGKIYEACSFNYIDYAGGTISDVLDDEQGRYNQAQLDKRVQEASVLLGLLDGQKVINFMHDHPSSIDWINKDLVSITQVMNKSIAPIHFVISKWDYVEESGFSLKEIKDKLLEIKELNMLIETRRDRIRLIPVSSVGKGFANFETMPDGNVRMIKTGKTSVQPYQVEVPLAYVMIDVIQNASDKLEEKIKEMNAIAKFLFLLKSIFVNPLIEFMPPGTQWISRELIDKINKLGIDQFSTVHRHSLAEIQDEKAAFDHIINCFQFIIDGFEDSGSSLMRKSQY